MVEESVSFAVGGTYSIDILVKDNTWTTFVDSQSSSPVSISTTSTGSQPDDYGVYASDGDYTTAPVKLRNVRYTNLDSC